MKYFCMINGTPRNVKRMNFHVDAEEAGLVGDYVDGKPVAPDRKQFRESLPYRWRAAFDRGGAFWFNRDGKPGCYTALHDCRGRYLATIYCNPSLESAT